MGPSSESSRPIEHDRIEKNCMDIQAMLDSVRLDGRINVAQVDALAAAIQQKLALDVGNDEAFRDMAKTFLRISVSNSLKHTGDEIEDVRRELHQNHISEDRHLTNQCDDPRVSGMEELPSPKRRVFTIPDANKSVQSSLTSSLPSLRYLSSAGLLHGENRGRSPSRSDTPGIPRPTRSRTPLDRPSRRFPVNSHTEVEMQSNGSSALESQAWMSPRRSRSPLHRHSHRGRHTAEGCYSISPESPSPTIFFDSHENLPTPITERAAYCVNIAPESCTPLSDERQALSSIAIDEHGYGSNSSSAKANQNNGGSFIPAKLPESSFSQCGRPLITSLQSAPLDNGACPTIPNRPFGSLEEAAKVPFEEVAALASPEKSEISPNQGRSSNLAWPSIRTPIDNGAPLKDVDFLYSPMEDTPESNGEVSSSPSHGGYGGCDQQGLLVRIPTRAPHSPSDHSPSMDGSSPRSIVDNHRNRSPRQTISICTEPEGPPTNPMSDNLESPSLPLNGPKAALSTLGSPNSNEGRESNSTSLVETAVKKKVCHATTPLLVEPDVKFQVDLSRAKSLRHRARTKRLGSFRKGGSCVTSSEGKERCPAFTPEDALNEQSNTTNDKNPADELRSDAVVCSRQEPSTLNDCGAMKGTFNICSPVSFLSPMDIDKERPPSTSCELRPDDGMVFHPGVGSLSPGSGRFQASTSRRRDPRNQLRQPRFGPHQDIYSPSSSVYEADGLGGGSVGENIAARPSFGPHSQISDKDPVLVFPKIIQEKGSSQRYIADSSGQMVAVMALRESARSLYLAGDYQSSILKYTAAISTCKSHFAIKKTNELLSILLSNRAAGLLMIGAFNAAVEDCQHALLFFLDPTSVVVSTNSGPVLQSKLYTRLGRALLKLGEAESSETAFDQAIHYANNSLGVCTNFQDIPDFKMAKKSLQQVIAEAALGKTEAARFRDTMNKVTTSFGLSFQSPGTSERRIHVEALGYVNMAISTASGCSDLHEKKVVILGSLKRWRELASHCERLACANVRLDGVFSDDIRSKHPFLAVPPAQSLTSDFFRCEEEADSGGVDIKLNSKAAAEAVMRMPPLLAKYYTRALRLEERYPAAESSLRALHDFVWEKSSVYDHDTIRSRFSWLKRERDMLNLTKSGREKGDQLFRNGDYDMAAAQYALCLTIDSEGAGSDNIDGSNAGGRLHAVLHCNRAACLMAVSRFQDAVAECTAALRIHSRYMKALLRRARCFARLERYDEAIAEYKRWIEMVQQARRTPLNSPICIAPCLFDGPGEASDEDVMQAKEELEGVSKTKLASEAAARAKASYRQHRQNWQHDDFNNATHQGDAHRRRDNFYSQKGTGSRRWDSFTDRGPRIHSRTAGCREEAKKKNGRKIPQEFTETVTDHYSTLEVRNNATDVEIKRAYRKMALKYHPDKNKAPEAVDFFRRVTNAYEVLYDSTTRRQYDTEIGCR